MRKLQSIIPIMMMNALAACGGEKNGAYVGYVEAEYVYVAAPQAGWLTTLAVREGDEVTAGDTLFELDRARQEAAFDQAAHRAAQAAAQAADIQTGARPAEIAALEAQLEEAKARLVQARAERDRWLPLVREGNASKARGDQVVADYTAALARVNAARDAIEVAELAGRDGARDAALSAAKAADAARAEAQWLMDQRSVHAKVSGRVEDVFHRAGELVQPGAPVLALLPPDGLKVRFFAPQSALAGIALGDAVSIMADGRAAPVSATVSFIAKEAEFTPPVIYSAEAREKLVFLIEARLDEPAGLLPGLPVDVSAP